MVINDGSTQIDEENLVKAIFTTLVITKLALRTCVANTIGKFLEMSFNPEKSYCNFPNYLRSKNETSID